MQREIVVLEKLSHIQRNEKDNFSLDKIQNTYYLLC